MKFLFLTSALVITIAVHGQDSLKVRNLDEIIVYATRANEKTPTTFTEVSAEDLKSLNLGQDLPLLLNFSPSLVTTSDAGAGIGYTGMRIRGSDATRINVTVNGIPLNDSESHGVFWVNMPDFSSSVSNIQIQRGVGTSSNGAAAFGATVNLQSSNVAIDPYFETNNTAGSFNTWKTNVIYNTGLLKDAFNFEARLSKITSDGYIDRSASDLKSYYLSGGRYGEKTMIKAVLFGGQEITQQAWYGTPEARLTGGDAELQELIDFGGEYFTPELEANLRNSGRTFNYYLYDNEIDNYRQDHYQLHLAHTLSDNWDLSGALHYTRGRGYFEQFRASDALSDYGLADVIVGTETVSISDIIRRRWLDNHFYGTTYAINYDNNTTNFTFGGAYNIYDGDHFGEIIWAEFASTTDIRDHYYDGTGKKKDFNVFAKINYQLNDRLNLFGDAQLRTINYETAGLDSDRSPYDINTDFTFLNPKVGLTYYLSNSTNLYASYAIGNREPVRSDFIDANPGTEPKHETLRNFEAGIRKTGSRFSYEANYYYMNYKNQLVVTGAVNDVGAPIRTNVPKSFRMGIEFSGILKLTDDLKWSPNLTLSRNKIDQFSEIVFASFGEIQHSDSDISFSPNVIGGSNLSFTPTNGLTFQLLTKYVGKQFLDNTSNDDRAIDAYLTNDLRLSYEFETAGIQNIGFSLLINNILDTEYSSNGYTWGYYYGADVLYQQNNYYPQAGRNFLLGMNLRF